MPGGDDVPLARLMDGRQTHPTDVLSRAADHFRGTPGSQDPLLGAARMAATGRTVRARSRDPLIARQNDSYSEAMRREDLRKHITDGLLVGVSGREYTRLAQFVAADDLEASAPQGGEF